MFAKLLKHDLRAVFKYWWIGAVAVLGISVFGGFSSRLTEAVTKYDAITSMGVFGMIFSYIAIYLIPLFTQIVLIIRYYRHFFSDEGYLTFTLPVKKTSLLDSKLITGFIYMLSSYALMFVCFCIMGFIESIHNDFIFLDAMEVTFLLSAFDFTSMFGGGLSHLGGYAVPCIILFVLSVIVYIFLFNAFIYACMTIASAIAKKHKVLVGISLYVGVRVFIFIITRAVLISSLFYSYNTSTDTVSVENEPLVSLYVLMGVLGLLITLFGALYYFITVLLNKRLNLV